MIKGLLINKRNIAGSALVKVTLFLALFILLTSLVFLVNSEEPQLQQNNPVEVNTLVTFTITMDTSNSEVPYIAWDFGDGDGLGRYRKSLTATKRFTEPGVYQVFARIQGENIPLTVTQTVYAPRTAMQATHSSTITMDDERNNVWVVNADNNSITAIDTETDQFSQEIAVGKHPRTLDLDNNGNVWVACEDDAQISIVTPNGEIDEMISLPYASRPFGICLDPEGTHAYVTLQGTGEVMKIDVGNREIVQSVSVGRSPRGIAVTPDGARLFITQFISPEDHGIVRKIHTTDMTVEKEVELAFDQTPDFEDKGRGVPNYISSITITPDGSQAWVPSKKDNVARGLFRDGNELTFDNTVRTIVSRIDVQEGSEMLDLRTDINDSDMACAVEFSPYGNIAFIALQGNNKISMINVETNSRLGSIDSTGLSPQGLVLNADGTKLYVHNFMSRTVRVYDTEDIILSNNLTPVRLATISTVQSENLNPVVLEGKQLFYNAADRRMNSAGYISCASCHLDGGSDERVWDFTDRGEGFRNTQSLLGRGGTSMGNVHWTANFDEIQDFENDIRNAFGGEGFMADSLFNSGTVSDPLGDPKAGLSPELDALAAYVSSLDEVHPSPYRHEDGSLTADAVQGKMIFMEAGCNQCHSGSMFTDRPSGELHDVGTLKSSSGNRRGETLTGIATPTLKGVWETAPYLHDGSAPTLYDVLVTQNEDGQHADLSDYTTTEIDQLISYLKQIDETSDDPVTSVFSDFLNEKTAAVSVFPNPAQNNVTITIHHKNPSGTLAIYDQRGVRKSSMLELKGNSSIQVDVSNYPSGVYIINYSDHNKTMQTKLIVP